MKREVLRIERVTREENGIVYLNDLSLWIGGGEILGMIATNQHGMDRLIELISDNVPIKYGQVYFEGELVNDYIRGGSGNNRVCIIDNRIRLVPGLTVTDNIFVLRKGFKKYVINSRVLEQQVQMILNDLGFRIRADMLVEGLTPYERCVIELVKAMISGVKLIVLHDIGAMIGYADLQNFYKLITHYKSQGITFLYIGNHHEDVFKICTRFVMYESGRIKKILYSDEMDDEHIKPFVQPIKESALPRRDGSSPVMTLQNVSSGSICDFSCQIFAGECLTILDKDHSVLYDFVDLFMKRKKHKRHQKERVLLIPEDPVNRYLFLDQSYLYNLCFQVDRKIGRSILPAKVKKSIAKEWQEEIGTYLNADTLRNIPIEARYDLIFYRIILYRPQIVLMIQPFSGADMYLRIHIANLITKLKAQGIAVVVLTTYVADTLAVTDQMVLVENGRRVTGKSMLDSQFIKDNYYKSRFVDKTMRDDL